MVSFMAKIILLLGVCFGIGLGDDRLYTISVTTGSSQSDETNNPVYFRIIGVDGTITDWFKYDSFPSRGTKYTFTRCLNDVGQVKQLEMIRKNSDHIVVSEVSVDDLTHTLSSRIVLGCCCWQLLIDFDEHSATRSSMSSSYCSSVNSNIIAQETCQTNSPSSFPTFNPTLKPSPSPTKVPSPVPTSATSFCEYTHQCKAWGDPHITTFDRTKYHFQGEGYFDYVTSCIGDNSVPLPFTISALHKKCRGDFTCINQVIVQFIDSTNTKTSVIISSDGIPSVSVGTYAYLDINGYDASYTVSIDKNGFGVVEIFFIHDDGTATQSNLKVSYKNKRLIIDGSDCLFGDNHKCGLCGNINDDDKDDFIRCDDNIQITTEGSNGYNEPAWTNVHNFGESCCNGELDLLYLGNSDCEDVEIIVPPPPVVSCIEDAKLICSEAYDKYCKDCTSSNGADDEFLTSCAIDLCAQCKDSDGNINVFSVDEAMSNGCLDTSIYECVWDKLDEISNILF